MGDKIRAPNRALVSPILSATNGQHGRRRSRFWHQIRYGCAPTSRDYATPMKYTATIAAPDNKAKIAATILFNGYIDPAPGIA